MNFVLFAKMDQVFSLKNKTLKNTGKSQEKSGNFVSLEKWEPCTYFFPYAPQILVMQTSHYEKTGA